MELGPRLARALVEASLCLRWVRRGTECVWGEAVGGPPKDNGPVHTADRRARCAGLCVSVALRGLSLSVSLCGTQVCACLCGVFLGFDLDVELLIDCASNRSFDRLFYSRSFLAPLTRCNLCGCLSAAADACDVVVYVCVEPVASDVDRSQSHLCGPNLVEIPILFRLCESIRSIRSIWSVF